MATLSPRNLPAHRPEPVDKILVTTGIGVKFDGGDVTITYKIRDCILEGKVCSQAMAMASLFLKRTLSTACQPQLDVRPEISSDDEDVGLRADDGSESSNSGGAYCLTPTSDTPDIQLNKCMDFTKDDGKALLMILRIVHLQFRDIPSQIPSKSLWQLAKLCDRYQCGAILQPWLAPYIAFAKHETLWPLGQEQWIFIDWAFGLEEDFIEISRSLVRKCKVTSAGEYLTASGKEVLDSMPPKIIPCILHQRRQMVRDLFEYVYGPVEHFEERKKPTSPTYCCTGNVKCDAMLYGSLLSGLQSLNLWPRVKPERVLIQC